MGEATHHFAWQWLARLLARAAVVLVAVSLIVLHAACSTPQPQDRVSEAEHASEIEKWQAERHAGLTKEDGWLTLIGLHWLKEGQTTIGSDPRSGIALPAGKIPPLAGSIRVEGTKAWLRATPGVEITSHDKPVSEIELLSDMDAGGPTILKHGSLTFHTIRRGDKLALRVRDKESPARANFKRLEYFPIEKKWRVVARLEPYNPVKTIPIMNVLGMESMETSPGALTFKINGTEYRLDPIVETGETQFFLIFADQTRGKETYGAGRYLYVDPPDASGNVIIDFNKAYSPPCAFTKFATCPLPPEQNRLPLRIESGEKFSEH
jgi:uncharacterized protein